MEIGRGQILREVAVIEMAPIRDHRGSFTRTYCSQEFEKAGLNTEWVQCNETTTLSKGSVRGMH